MYSINTIFLSSSHQPCRDVTNSLKQNSLSHFYSLREMPPTSLIAHLPSLNTLQYRTFKFETIWARLSRTCLTGTSLPGLSWDTGRCHLPYSSRYTSGVITSRREGCAVLTRRSIIQTLFLTR